MLHVLSYSSYSPNEGALVSSVVGIYSSHEKAYQEMITGITKVTEEYDKDDRKIDVGNYCATYANKHDYLIEYQIQEFDSIQ